MNRKLPHSPLTSLIIDDEISAHDEISQYIAEIEWMDKPQSCLNPVKAIEMIQLLKPDIIFLDIEMPHLSGTELLDILGPTSAAVIVISSHRDYAWKGYEYQVQDFLTKPIKFSKLLRAINKVRLAYIANLPLPAANTAPNIIEPGDEKGSLHASEMSASDRSDDRIRFGKIKMWIKEKESIVRISYDELYMIKSDGNYVKLFTKTKVYHIREGLAQMLKSLPDYFIQTHRSYIVNSELVIKIYHDTILFSEYSENAPISKRHRPKLYKKLGHIHG